MRTTVQPYLFFNGRCEEALEFYKKSLGAEVTALMRFKDSPEKSSTDTAQNKIMHANLRIGDTQIMASDGNGDSIPVFEGFALTLNVTTEADADRLFSALSDGGQVRMPLVKTFYSPRFGMVIDRFGVLWMVLTETKTD